MRAASASGADQARLSRRRRRRGREYVLAQVTWGFPQTLLGAVIAVGLRGCPRGRYRNAVVTYWRKDAGLSLGLFLFLPQSAAPSPSDGSMSSSGERLHRHEYGHTVQSLILGPLYLPVVGLPSLVWASFPPLARKWRSGDRDYYSFVTERTADGLSALVTGDQG